jgi:hypothetical protein
VRKFNITWSGQSLGNGASATGFIVVDDAVAPTVGSQDLISTSDVIDLGITITGSQAGNGTFGKSDFSWIYFATPAPLDLGHELIGQTLGNGYNYGDNNANGAAGDFNLFASTDGAPNGTWFFMLTAGNGGDTMLVTSMTPGGVPEPASWALMIGGFGAIGAAMRHGRKAKVSFA